MPKKSEREVYFMTGVLWTLLWVLPPFFMLQALDFVEGPLGVLVIGGAILWVFMYPNSKLMKRAALRFARKSSGEDFLRDVDA